MFSFIFALSAHGTYPIFFIIVGLQPTPKKSPESTDWSKIKFLLGAFIGVGRRPTKTKQKEKTFLLYLGAMVGAFIYRNEKFFLFCSPKANTSKFILD